MFDKKSLQDRFKIFAISIVRFAEELPDKGGFRTIKNQIIRSGPSTAANYRSACRAKSPADFIHKMGTVEEEIDETMFWLEFTDGLSDDYKVKTKLLWDDANELLAITVSSIKTARMNHPKSPFRTPNPNIQTPNSVFQIPHYI